MLLNAEHTVPGSRTLSSAEQTMPGSRMLTNVSRLCPEVECCQKPSTLCPEVERTGYVSRDRPYTGAKRFPISPTYNRVS
ncbi:hypothetical protein DPMN_075326 [Dreissena polymorpha]|uniref:Uncharacterized protein n=1 Tax=Dreissena polymorpha TaxID=45954 RepID=A0A9D4BET4_DREPO|nr:hypothetical protein DPMN_075326 [Dreissena polymorpha]